MKTIITNCFFVLLSCFSIASAQQNNSHFTASSPSSPAIVSFNCQKDSSRVLLNWTVNKNEHAYMFEIERSTDGIYFGMAALVFGTDKVDMEQYKFFGKEQESKTFYRVRIVHRDKTFSYSDMIVCD
jgi:hypothetical protein